MKKLDSLRRYLPSCFCFSSSTTTTTKKLISTTTTTISKKRMSTSSRDDHHINLIRTDANGHVHGRVGGRGEQEAEYSSSALATAYEESVTNSYYPVPVPAALVPPRSSKSMVIGTLFGHRRGHVSFCIQHDRLNSKPTLLLEFSVPTQKLVREMRCGLVRITLECDRADLSSCPLHSVPIWTMCINGRKVGFASKRRATDKDRLILKIMQSSTVGAGVIPAALTSMSATSTTTTTSGSYSNAAAAARCSTSSTTSDHGGVDCGEGELIYMRANYERVIGNLDSESYHLVNPDGFQGQELSLFFLRSR